MNWFHEQMREEAEQYLEELKGINTIGEFALGENIDSAIAEAKNILAGDIDDGQAMILEDLNMAFEEFLNPTD